MLFDCITGLLFRFAAIRILDSYSRRTAIPGFEHASGQLASALNR